MDIDAALDIAIKNIARHGDTDVFPYPLETLIFHDKPDECKALLLELHNNFDDFLAQYPPSTLETLTQVGYTGFRWTTQIEPFWNAYYLALVVQLAEKIEAQRIPLGDETIFSYRYDWNDGEAKLFIDSTWNNYRKKALELSNDYSVCSHN
jgi:hypothetical protein